MLNQNRLNQPGEGCGVLSLTTLLAAPLAIAGFLMAFYGNQPITAGLFLGAAASSVSYGIGFFCGRKNPDRNRSLNQPLVESGQQMSV